MTEQYSFKPWDVTSLKLCLDGDDDTWIEFKFWNLAKDEGKKNWFDIDLNPHNTDDPTYQNIDLDAAIRLRDFLNYVLPKDNK